MAGRNLQGKSRKNTDVKSGKRKVNVARTAATDSPSTDSNSTTMQDGECTAQKEMTAIPGIACFAVDRPAVTRKPALKPRETKSERWNRQVQETLEWAWRTIKT